MQGETSVAGFVLESTYARHNCPVRVLTKNTSTGAYLSLDQQGVRIWNSTGPPASRDVKRVDFPKADRGFISRIIYVPSQRLYFGAALDMNIQVFDNDFKFMQAVPSGQRSVLCLDFDVDAQELISAGIDGVKIWRFRLAQLLRFRKSTTPPNPASDYCLQERLHIAEFSHTMVLPVAKPVSHPDAHNLVEPDTPTKGTLSWVFEACRFESFLFVVTGGAVVALDVRTGQWLDTWQSMHEQDVTSVLFYSPRRYMLTASNDCTIKVWTVRNNLTSSAGPSARGPTDETVSLVKTFTCHRCAEKLSPIYHYRIPR